MYSILDYFIDFLYNINVDEKNSFHFQILEEWKLMSKMDDVKQQTLELYESLPQEKEARKSRTDVRDKVLELNYSFFGYIASHTFINNSSVTYEDKLQSALCNFCYCWWWFRWKGDETHKGYRQDISFTSFFKLRIGEMIERELNEVKYSIRRSLCMEAGKQLGKHWSQVKYEDLSKVDLPVDKMNSLKSIFGSLYVADLEDHEMFIPADNSSYFSDQSVTDDNYNSVHEFLIHEMVEKESPLTDEMLYQYEEDFGIPFAEMKKQLPLAMEVLRKRLEDSIAIQDAFNDNY